MITKLFQGQDRLRACGWIAAFAMAATAVSAQTPAPRIRSEITNAEVTQLKPTQQALVPAEFDAGRMPSNTRLNGMSIAFNRTAAQQAGLEALLAAQQNPSSPFYHQWLNPDQFAARFGMSQADLDKVQTWLQQQGFSIDSVARSKNMIRFSGTVGQLELAFQTQMHYFKTSGEMHFAPSTVLSLPSAIASTVEAVGNLSDFRPKPMHVKARKGFTSGVSKNVFFAPGDIATTYDINPLYTAGVTGTGQSIAIVGQSAIQTNDIENFESAAGLPMKDPVMVLVPGSGTSTIVSGGDEGESDLDVEWSGAIAKGATINFVYVGNDPNQSAFSALIYAIDEKIAPIISSSYGACETAVQLNGGFATFESAFQQAAAQGQTILAASGDQGSTACSGDTVNGLTTTQQFAEAVNYPASSAYVTAVGGTAISTANDNSSNTTYWSINGTQDVLNSAKIYIPEVVWNDSSAQFGLSASGGGVSAEFAKPSYQTGVPGIPSDGKRDVPDVSLYSSPDLPGYLFCSSDQSDWIAASTSGPAQAASCNSGFRDGTSGGQYLTIAGGTSFAAPIFAGMLALINQKQEWTAGQGQANIALYKLAGNSTTYGSAFHDVTSGNNNCNAGTTFCGTTTGGFSAGTGYDLATGLGSVDLNVLAGAWPANATPLLGTTTTVSAATSAPDVSANDTVTITVAESNGTGTPTGTVNLSIDGSGTTFGAGGSTLTPVTLTSNGTATYTANFATAGAHTIVAQYAGDSTHVASTGSIVISVGGTSSGKGTIKMGMTPATLTVSRGAQGSESLAITPSGGYTGSVNLTYSTSNDSALANLCVFAGTNVNQDGSITISNASAVTGIITIDTNAADCVNTTGAALKGRGLHVIPRSGGSAKASNNVPKRSNPIPAGIAFAGLLIAGFLGKSSRKLRQLACVIALASLGLMLTACGGGVSGNTVSDPAKGTYTITFAGADSTNSAITAQSSFSLVID
ncbi:MAG TPA: protease pro-enzyme activation domain-containing protein [Terracidiphilus sp.]|jgi:subtilase family serine protease